MEWWLRADRGSALVHYVATTDRLPVAQAECAARATILWLSTADVLVKCDGRWQMLKGG